MNVDLLLLAAEYVNRLDQENDHGYASLSRPTCVGRTVRSKPLGRNRKRNTSAGRGRGSAVSYHRSLHNQLEKHRRAELRGCIEKLKQVVPVGPDASKHTTQRLLSKSLVFIKSLEASLRERVEMKDRLIRIQCQLRHRLRRLLGVDDVFRVVENDDERHLVNGDSDSSSYLATSAHRDRRWRQRDSGSESRCSTSSEQSELSTTSLQPSASENEFVDVIGGLEKQVDEWKYSQSPDSGLHSPLNVSPLPRTRTATFH